MKHNQKHNQKGFTLIELIVVVAIMGVIGAILIPQFSTMNLRARMSTDVSSIKTVQNQVEIYYNDKGAWPGDTPETIIEKLVDEDYLDERYVNDDNTLILQTKANASVGYNKVTNRLYLKLEADSAEADAYNNDDEIAAGWVDTGAGNGGTAGGTTGGTADGDEK